MTPGTRQAFTRIILAGVLGASALQGQAAENPDVVRLDQRLQALDADPATSQVAAYERLQARQSLQVLATARSAQQAAALQVAEQRVETAEVAARTATIRSEIDRLDRERSELLIEASRQDAARARQEAEHLRIQAQIQAEEAARLQQQANDEVMAREDAENALDDVAGAQAAKLKAARQREAELARREAELMGTAPPAQGKSDTKPAKNKP